MKNEQREKKNGLYLVCNKTGQIVDVLFDSFGLVPKELLPIPLFNILDKESISKSSAFWNDIQNLEFVSGYELLVTRDEKASLPLKFSAGNFNDKIWIIAASRDEDLNNMLEEMVLMNNEQQNIIRRTEKKLSEVSKSVDQISFDSYDEISKVNNELVNAQRKLIKQNEEIHQLNSQLEKSNRELEHFAYSVSHDLKEPLRMIKSFMRLLKERYGDQLDERANKYIHFAVDGSERMNLLIGDLLEFSRIGRQNHEFTKADLNDVLEKVTMLLGSFIEEQNALVNWHELPWIVCQKMQMEQLFSNLITNSIKYRKEGETPVVEISCEEKPGEWLFTVSDNGKGIDPKYHTVVFDLFRRIDVSDRTEGTGMGLAICKKIVEQHGGKIWVESEAGKGSTFCFTIAK